MRTMAFDPFIGAVIETESGFPGLVKVLDCTTEQNAAAADGIPGSMRIDEGYKAGLYLPRGVFEMGTRPATLEALPPCEYAETPSGLRLYDYQLQGVTFIRNCGPAQQGVILGADPGLGKTMMALQASWLDHHLHRPLLICGPLGARNTWCGPRSDAKVHYDLDVVPLETTTPDLEILSQHNAFYIHYEIVHHWQRDLFNVFKPACLIVDESHLLANMGAKRTASMWSLAKSATIERRILLTGTPIPKTRVDLWAQLTMAQPNQWGDTLFKFGVRHCDGKRMTYEEGKGHWVYEGESNTEELKARLAGVYLRMTDDMVQALPDLERKVVDVKEDLDLTNYWNAQVGKTREIKKTRHEGFAVKGSNVKVPTKVVRKKVKAAHLSSLTALISELELAKAKGCVKHIVKETAEHDKIVVFCWRRETAKIVHKELLRYTNASWPKDWLIGPIDGSHSEKKRIAALEKFFPLKKGIFVCTRGAFNVSRNELASGTSLAVMISSSWNPSENVQTENRVRRKGNPNPKVTALYFRAPYTVDDLFLRVLMKKAEAAQAMAPVDTAGLQMVRDLDSQGLEDSAPDLDKICEILAEMEDEDEDE